jgi:hypothetical protein
VNRAFLIVAIAAALAGCNRDSTQPALTLPAPTAPQTVYTGTITDSVVGTGAVTLSLGTSGSQIGGTWLASFPGQRSTTRFVTGTVNGTSLSATVSDCLETDSQGCFPNCRQILTGTLTSGGLSATYAEVPGDSCTAHSGSLSANRQ